jgi:hypothetical protein
MEFCKDCGGVLNLFGNNEAELCSSCIQQKKPAPPAAAGKSGEFDELLEDSVLVCRNNKIILKSREGWELWSAPVSAETDLKTALKRAQRIYEIRSRRRKN